MTLRVVLPTAKRAVCQVGRRDLMRTVDRAFSQAHQRIDQLTLRWPDVFTDLPQRLRPGGCTTMHAFRSTYPLTGRPKSKLTCMCSGSAPCFSACCSTCSTTVDMACSSPCLLPCELSGFNVCDSPCSQACSQACSRACSSKQCRSTGESSGCPGRVNATTTAWPIGFISTQEQPEQAWVIPAPSAHERARFTPFEAAFSPSLISFKLRVQSRA